MYALTLHYAFKEDTLTFKLCFTLQLRIEVIRYRDTLELRGSQYCQTHQLQMSSTYEQKQEKIFPNEVMFEYYE